MAKQENPFMEEVRLDYEGSKDALEILESFPANWRELRPLKEHDNGIIHIVESLETIATQESEAILKDVPEELKKAARELGENYRFIQGLIAFGIAYERFILSRCSN